ncbi:helix-turn-helix transcriptional regulator [Marimonas lutisalis]|uniref:helix-turn-helix transcriptional regulator n=1 Tax=Marimonas lutisalis TaxID=2545756 RepID=UPI0010FA0B3B|nr:helix-turn-helix domain-containing protein [Marimonas lutisalis]
MGLQAMNPDKLLSRAEVEEQYGISKRFLERSMNDGNGVRYVRVGRLVRYRASDVVAWIEQNSMGGHK